MNAYDRGFYEVEKAGSLLSAQRIVPYVLRYVRPRSVVDVGCGIGTWLSVFKAQGVDDILGIDGDYVDRGMLMIHPSEFAAHDLTRPVHVGRRFDLAVSLEVAEHLPEAQAKTFVTSLTNLAPVVLFSAAIPRQGGRNHVNEQWPAYWAQRFAERGFRAIDCLRAEIWDLQEVKPHYPQNMMFYVHEPALAEWPELEVCARSSPQVPPAWVHPGIFDYQIGMLSSRSELRPGNVSLGRVLGLLPGLIVFEVRKTLIRVLQRVAPGALRQLREMKKRSVSG